MMALRCECKNGADRVETWILGPFLREVRRFEAVAVMIS
jgi:hypothetical protein